MVDKGEAGVDGGWFGNSSEGSTISSGTSVERFRVLDI